MVQAGDISKISVSEEIDPGFGPDTEQRRVEFASKLEQEAFSIALGDATKLAQINLITALKVWGNKFLIAKVKSLGLKEIMLIWLIFELSFIVKVWEILYEAEWEKLLEDEEIFEKFLEACTTPLSKDVPMTLKRVKINVKRLEEIREMYGGDLIFALKSKNKREIEKIYEMTYSKLPQSLREEFLSSISGSCVEMENILKLFSKGCKDLLNTILKIVIDKLKRDVKPIDDKKIRIILKIVEVFDKDSASFLRNELETINEGSRSEVKAKVRNYYGIK
ncbi:hypothetical protein JW766_02125 [Candidatus Dojkabacteria bacterium]|nr:hypothetical protein [Candidatus Dojkabacteria bacterium]